MVILYLRIIQAKLSGAWLIPIVKGFYYADARLAMMNACFSGVSRVTPATVGLAYTAKQSVK
jgi:hypothetical protein